MIVDTKASQADQADADGDVFDLDITVLEVSDEAAELINLTDDGCGSTCASPCATAVV